MDKAKGVTVKELRVFLSNLPESYDDFELINGEVISHGDGYFTKTERPIIHMEIDEEYKDLCFLHQSEQELEVILNEINGYGTA